MDKSDVFKLRTLFLKRQWKGKLICSRSMQCASPTKDSYPPHIKDSYKSIRK